VGILKKNSDILLTINQCIDILIIATAFWAAFTTRDLTLNSPVPYLFIFFISITCCHFSLRISGVYKPFRKQRFTQIFTKICQASITGTAGIIFIMYLLHMDAVSRLFLAYFTAYQILFFALAKGTLFYILLRNRSKDYNTRNVLIVGTKARAMDLIKEIQKSPGSGYRIYGCVDTVDKQENVGKTLADTVSVVGTMDDFKEILLKNVIDEVIFALPLKKIPNIHEHILFTENIGVKVRILPDFQIQKIMYHPETAKITIDSFLGIPTMSLSSTPHRESALILKSLIDYSMAGFGIILLLPFFIITALLIKVNSKGPIFFTQTRSGLNGRNFTLYKFRTMVADAESLKAALCTINEMDGPVFKMKHDPRITKVGSFLRKTSLDELPQLFNILKGEMSLVGPRPPLPSEVREYRHWQRRKLSMKPGLTCIWQVSGRNTTSFDEWMRMDLEYIDNWSLILDIKLLILTVKEVLYSRGQ
jgi:exopolysaccharide biosynthesis polyprenyl glycosylphosphotransferase